ncbi:hypothetical protein EYF80_054612 [Liparis tanakae]|uniref:Uncharacterized protein n=1 Tax=Liparis tanakae TaxID=230148 RepID=A0A4Z2F249_9TELE|nr:hypothetical protein EYF80_054612 [Liparis tanakae]
MRDGGTKRSEEERGGARRSEEERGRTGTRLTHRHTAPRRRLGLQFMLSDRNKNPKIQSDRPIKSEAGGMLATGRGHQSQRNSRRRDGGCRGIGWLLHGQEWLSPDTLSTAERAGGEVDRRYTAALSAL